jgi:uncharacterized protein (DUF1501 family)
LAPTIYSRSFLKLAAFTPALPGFLAKSAEAIEQAPDYRGNVLIIVRMIGGNDGLNATIPVRDDTYYKGRPTIAISKPNALPLAGGDMALHPALSDFRWLIDEGVAGVIQNVGYARSSRSHLRSTEIFETASTDDKAPVEGWLGRYLDQVVGSQIPAGSPAGVEFGDQLGRTLSSQSRSSRSIAYPRTLAERNLPSMRTPKMALSSLDRIRTAQNELAETSRLLQRAQKASGSRSAYPDSKFGESLRWVANMIETACPTRLFYVTLGSFDSGFSFDTHLNQLAAHEALYTELGRGFRALAEQLRKAGALDRVQLLTFSDFGRQVTENNQGGTDHGDASVLFAVGGKMKPGLHGQAPDITGAYDGGLPAKIDFRQIYANVLDSWLGVDAQKVLSAKVEPYKLIA